ncbi:MAG: hypothetical protein WD645_01280 [Dehalococcoidia bacterium]
MDLHDILNDTSPTPGERYVVPVSFAEAHLLDWVLTAHQWDQELISRLDTDRIWAIREEVARRLVGHTDVVSLEHDDVRLLLIITPVLFAVGTEEVGSSLKRKLYECLVGPAPQEVKHASASEDETGP